MMAPNSHHLIQISIVEEYRIFWTINLDKNDDFVYSTKNVYLYFAIYFEMPFNENNNLTILLNKNKN
jgi:hypothetical protein